MLIRIISKKLITKVIMKMRKRYVFQQKLAENRND